MKIITVDSAKLRGLTLGQSGRIGTEIDMHVDTLRNNLQCPGNWRLKDLNKLCQVLDLDPQTILLFQESEK